MPKAGDSWPLWYATIHGPPGSRLKEFLLYIPFFFSHNVSCSFLWAPPWTGYQGPRFSQSSTMKQLNIEGNLLYLSYPLPICIMRWLLGNFYSVFCYYLLNLTYLLFCFVLFNRLPSHLFHLQLRLHGPSAAFIINTFSLPSHPLYLPSHFTSTLQQNLLEELFVPIIPTFLHLIPFLFKILFFYNLSHIICFCFNVYALYVLLHVRIFHKVSSEMNTQVSTTKLKPEHHMYFWSSLWDPLSVLLFTYSPIEGDHHLEFCIYQSLALHYSFTTYTHNPNNILLGFVCLCTLYETWCSSATHFFIQSVFLRFFFNAIFLC